MELSIHTHGSVPLRHGFSTSDWKNRKSVFGQFTVNWALVQCDKREASGRSYRYEGTRRHPHRHRQGPALEEEVTDGSTRRATVMDLAKSEPLLWRAS